MNKILHFFRNLKITYKLFFIFSILIYVLINSWFFSYTTAKDVEESFQNLETYTFPYLLTTNNLKDNLHTSLLAAYDYISTNNSKSKELYLSEMRSTHEASIYLFEISQTERDLEFTSKFIEEQISKIQTAADEMIFEYETNPDSENLEVKLKELSSLRSDFNTFLEGEINFTIQNQVTEASDYIQKRVGQITIYLIVVISFVVVIIVLLVLFISNNITKPVHLLTQAAKDFGHGKFTEVKLDRKDEIGLFANTFNKMAKDISATQKALQLELTKTKELDQQKSEFLSIAAHQLRTPMSGIKWMMKMLLDGDMGKITEEQKHHLANGLNNSERMIKLINDLLDVTKIEEQKFQYKLEIGNIDNIINSVINNLKPIADDKKIKINLIKNDTLPEIKFDNEKIKIAFTNIIDNSIKYSPKNSSVDIELKKDRENIIIAITDHGYGIPKNQQAQIFSKFFRGSNILKIETDLETIGTGLGLYITNDIITKHDGKISFSSTEGKGTTFVINLPLDQ